MAQVVTLAHLHLAGEISLCARHAKRPPKGTPALGPVTAGPHLGECDACAEQEAEREARKEAREYHFDERSHYLTEC